ncbi:MAG: UDP-N-acetylmuramoyl-tripeptide--D-alanyl-D-alanine ligase [Oscillospiraceae bacterium]|nr:UDP-N-acetylmuramoyl-tripeptide--D-alanyl-D-alanine ligase [Oscillospiraceae bacterium]
MMPIQPEKLFHAMTERPLPMTKAGPVVTDSRQVVPGCVFVAIKGERVDGCDYAAAAVKNGAAFVVSERPIAQVPAEKLILVPDILDAMIQMGGNYRDAFSPFLAGVTGSVGKTTTKEFLYAVFSSFGETVKTQGNQNNEIGMPNTLFQLSPSTRYAVVEMGMQGLGEISKLTRAAKPQAAIITAVGVSHLQRLGSRENICRAKMEICEGLPPGGLLAVNGDDDYLPGAPLPPGVNRVFFGLKGKGLSVTAENIRQEGDAQRFTIRDENGALPAYIPALGTHNVYNALAAYTLAVFSGLDREKTAAALSRFETTGYRQHLREIGGIRVLEDCYNANPDSMRAALCALAELDKKGAAIAVLGDMLELGAVSEEAHYEAGALAAKKGVQSLILVGEECRAAEKGAREAGLDDVVWCGAKAEALEALLPRVKKGDAVLFKASRGMKLEEIMQEFYYRLEHKGE